MTEISHEQAQVYLQAAADESIREDEKARLDAHLTSCDACRKYAERLGKLETVLHITLHRRWNVASARLPLSRILGRQNSSPLQRALSVAATPILITILVLITVIAARGNITSGNDNGSPSTTIVIATVPTPSSQLIYTTTTFANCEYIIYTIQEGDTLEAISAAYSIPKEALIKFNNLKTEQLIPSESLALPLCERRATSTPSTTLTYTPALSSTSFTP